MSVGPASPYDPSSVNWKRPYALYERFFKLSPVDDPWSLLRRDYTGANLVLAWIALLVFLFPRILTAVGLYLLSVSEELTEDIVETINSHPGAPRELVQSVNQLVQVDETHRVWRVVLGVHEGGIQSFAWAGLIFILFIYTMGRFYLTLRVTPLRDAETRSGKTPARRDYEPIFVVHRFIRPIGGLAILFLLYNAWHFLEWLLTAQVSLP